MRYGDWSNSCRRHESFDRRIEVGVDAVDDVRHEFFIVKQLPCSRHLISEGRHLHDILADRHGSLLRGGQSEEHVDCTRLRLAGEHVINYVPCLGRRLRTSHLLQHLS